MKMLTKRAGGIYLARLGDYDHPKVSPVGMKVIQTLSDAQRQAICSAGAELREEGYSYDLPGLVRELAHLCLGISIPAEPHMLFCSAFCQEAYRRALGEAGDFAPRHAVTDVTPDDIWYSARGVRLLPRGLTVRMEGGAS
ncbi:MAG: hypothetical protein HY898_14645 [Deltaproteobacteria bacterium]|nr:hypothetical protein [Deltaproteobacteria bacterium]